MVRPDLKHCVTPLVTQSYVTTGGDEGEISTPRWHVHRLLLVPEESYLLSLLSLVEITDGVSQVENCFLIDI